MGAESKFRILLLPLSARDSSKSERTYLSQKHGKIVCQFQQMAAMLLAILNPLAEP